jgi:hypothetical protein
MTSKFVEVLDKDLHTSSPQLDVRLEDILAQSDLSSRARSTSGSSVESSSSENLIKGRSPQIQKAVSSKRRPRIFSLTGR